jgi:tRNA-5-taurinomethyluridine 2-sulfurtransferase
VRHSPEFHDCTLVKERSEENGDALVVHLAEDDQGLAAGQFAAFYSENVCLGSGIILDSWDKMSFPVCSRALEIAKLADKSSLGKPIRIVNLEHIVKPEQQEEIKVT